MPAPRGGLPPRLAQPPGTGLALSLSHSGACVAIALARPGPVGIDVEAKRALPDLEGLARRALTDEEAHVLASLPAAQRESVFLRWWTAKEAALKAHGSGLATPLARTILACDTSQNPVAVSITDGGGALGYEICTIDDARTQGAVVALAAHMSEPKFAAASAAEIFNEPDSQISTA
jgi:4'-phosphopantetheinyl transferase